MTNPCTNIFLSSLRDPVDPGEGEVGPDEDTPHRAKDLQGRYVMLRIFESGNSFGIER